MATTTPPVPSVRRFVSVFGKLLTITEKQRELLRIHHAAADHTITATEMARAAGYDHYGVANLHYGLLGRAVGRRLRFRPEREWLGTLVTFENRFGECHWVMRPEVAAALVHLKWVKPAKRKSPTGVVKIAPEPAVFPEGSPYQVVTTAYERNPQARRACLRHHGTACAICGFDFRATYGESARDFIHVHHLRPLAEVAAVHRINPVKDLRPVCPNCHAVIHSRTPPLTINEVRGLLTRPRKPR